MADSGSKISVSDSADGRDLEALFERHHDRVFRAAYRVTGSPADAEDVLQTVFLRLARGSEAAITLDNPDGYFARAAINASLDLLRARKRSKAVAVDDIEGHAAIGLVSRRTPESAHEDRELRGLIREAVAKLGPTAGQMFALRYFEGYDNGEIGQIIAADKPLLWMLCCAPLRVSAEVDEEDIAQVRPGQEVLIRADAFPGKIFRGTVQSITPKGDPVARTYRVRIALPEDTPLMIGMTAETNIVLRNADNALLVPAGAVQQDVVWRVTDGKLEKQKVIVGAKDAREVEILSGLRDGDRIVASPTPGLTAGETVRPYEAVAR